MAWARPPIRTPLWEAVDKQAKLHKIVRGKVQVLPREQMCRRAPLKSPSMLCSAVACCSLVQVVRTHCCRLPMASTKVVQGMDPLAASKMPALPTSTPALLEPRSTCSPTNQTGRLLCCRSFWPGQAPPPGWPDHDLALVTAAPDADGAVLIDLRVCMTLRAQNRCFVRFGPGRLFRVFAWPCRACGVQATRCGRMPPQSATAAYRTLKSV